MSQSTKKKWSSSKEFWRVAKLFSLLTVICLGLMAMSSTRPPPDLERQPRLVTFYKTNAGIVSKQSAGDFTDVANQSPVVQLPQLNRRVAASQFKSITYVAWNWIYADPIANAMFNEIKVQAVPYSRPEGRTIDTISAGLGTRRTPALIALNDRLWCFISNDSDEIVARWTGDGRNWSQRIVLQTPNGERLSGMDVVGHQGSLILVAIVNVPFGSYGQTEPGLFFGRVTINPDNSLSWDQTRVHNPSMFNPDSDEGVSLDSNGSLVAMGYSHGTSALIATSPSGIDSWDHLGIPTVPTEPMYLLEKASFTPQTEPSRNDRPSVAFISDSSGAERLHAVYVEGVNIVARVRASNGSWSNPQPFDGSVREEIGTELIRITVLSSN